jgi:UDP-N-acetylglucosamine 2-epimerase (non-hydrolysing)
MTIACIVGARPNFIKMAPILKELARHPNAFRPVLVHTGQHYDAKMSDVFFRDLAMPAPDHYLGVGAGAQAQQAATIMERFDDLCAKEHFDRVLVVGDVTSTMACAITAAKRCIPVDHVEAGLRSFDRTMPEEINRIITDSVADLLFVTEPSGVRNLLGEGHQQEQIKLVGNVMIDSLRSHRDKAVALAKWRDFGMVAQGYALVTLHRPSNVDDVQKLQALVSQLSTIANRIPVIFPVHPRTRKNLNPAGTNGALTLCEPLGYLDFLSLMASARVVITDSGGIQEETTVLGVPCLTLRTNTERPITVELGTNTLIAEGTDALERLVSDVLAGHYKEGQVPELWDGKAGERIVSVLAEKANSAGP